MMTSATFIHTDMVELFKKFDAAVETKTVSHSKRKGSIRALLDDLISEKKKLVVSVKNEILSMFYV